MEEWLSTKDAAKLAGVSDSTIYTAGNQGKIVRKRVGSDPTVNINHYLKSSVLAFAASRKAATSIGANAEPPALDADLWAAYAPAAKMIGKSTSWVSRLVTMGVVSRRIINGKHQVSISDLRRHYKLEQKPSVCAPKAEPMPPLAARLHWVVEGIKMQACTQETAYKLFEENVDK